MEHLLTLGENIEGRANALKEALDVGADSIWH